MESKVLAGIIILLMVGVTGALLMRVEPLVVLICLFLLFAIFLAVGMIHSATKGEASTESVNGRITNVEFEIEKLNIRIDLIDRD
jgi:hypothetical protein